MGPCGNFCSLIIPALSYSFLLTALFLNCFGWWERYQSYLTLKPCTNSGIQSFGLWLLQASWDSAHLENKTFRFNCTPPRRIMFSPAAWQSPRQHRDSCWWCKRKVPTPCFPKEIHSFSPQYSIAQLLSFVNLLWTSKSLGKLQKTSEEDRASRVLQRDLPMPFFTICPNSSNKIKKKTKQNQTTAELNNKRTEFVWILHMQDNHLPFLPGECHLSSKTVCLQYRQQARAWLSNKTGDNFWSWSKLPPLFPNPCSACLCPWEVGMCYLKHSWVS